VVTAGGAKRRGRASDILAAFTRNVAVRGYDAANFSEIGHELGISKGTIVHHYGTKHRLLATLHEKYMRARLEEARLICRRLETPQRQLAGLLFASILYQVHERDATVAFQREVARIAGTDGERLRDEYFGLVRDVIRRGVAEGVFRSGDMDVRTLLIFGASHWAWTWFRPDGEQSAEQVGATFVDLILGSLLVDRSAVGELADPDGAIAHTVRQCFDDVAEDLASAP
jgi:AcrR family transcriptional regulator